MTPIGVLLAGAAWVVIAVQQSFLPIEDNQIVALAQRETLTREVLFDRLARVRVVLVGESHDHPRHHQIQLETLQALRKRHPRMAVGMEMFPADKQPILDRWNRGELEEGAFLDEIQWYDVWGFDPELYLPILRFLKQERIPLYGLNVERDLVRAIRMQGLDGVDAEQREKLPPRAPASPHYREMLQEIFDSHPEVMRRIPFDNFVEAQQTWDSVMADGALRWLDANPDGVMVVLAGSGHVQKEGIPSQLRHRGVHDLAALLPWSVGNSWLRDGAAEYAWGTPPTPESPPPVRLGVQLASMGMHGHDHGPKKDEKKDERKDEEKKPAKPGVEIFAVTPDSPAEKGGIKVGDRILAIQGSPTANRHAVVRLVRGQKWNSVIEVKVLRDEKEVTLSIVLPEAPKEDEE